MIETDTENHLWMEADEGVATLWLDWPDLPANRLNVPRLRQLNRALDAAIANAHIEMLIIRSARLTGFSADIDLDALANLETDADRREYSRQGQAVLTRLREIPLVTIAFLEGPCLGPGLELALACDYRLAVATPSSLFGFPSLTIAPPCWGGVTQLIRTVGARTAQQFLEGQTVTAREAARLGVVDRAFSSRRSKIELQTFLDETRAHLQKRRDRSLWRDWLWRPQRRAGMFAKVVDAARKHRETALSLERCLFAECTSTPEAAVRLAVARAAETHQKRISKSSKITTWPTSVEILGNSNFQGQLGAELAIRGSLVHVLSAKSEETHPCVRNAFTGILKRGRLTPLECEQALQRVQDRTLSDSSQEATPPASWVLLAREQQELLPRIEASAGRGSIITLLDWFPDTRKSLLKRPDRVLTLAPGLFENTPIIELARSPATSIDALERVSGWLQGLGWMPVVVSEESKWISRRVLAVIWDEALRLVSEGASVSQVDDIAKAAGLGRPLELMDGLGFEFLLSLVPRLRPLTAAGLTGRPEVGLQGDGLYSINASDRAEPNVLAQVLLWDRHQWEIRNRKTLTVLTESTEDWCQRLMLRGVNEAAATLAQERYAGPEEIDLICAWSAKVYESAGGPLRYCDGCGLAEIVQQLQRLASRFGERFRPHFELLRRASAGESFHGTPQPASRSRVAA